MRHDPSDISKNEADDSHVVNVRGESFGQGYPEGIRDAGGAFKLFEGQPKHTLRGSRHVRHLFDLSLLEGRSNRCYSRGHVVDVHLISHHLSGSHAGECGRIHEQLLGLLSCLKAWMRARLHLM